MHLGYHFKELEAIIVVYIEQHILLLFLVLISYSLSLYHDILYFIVERPTLSFGLRIFLEILLLLLWKKKELPWILLWKITTKLWILKNEDLCFLNWWVSLGHAEGVPISKESFFFKTCCFAEGLNYFAFKKQWDLFFIFNVLLCTLQEGAYF